jgi:hypothetical protein
MSCWTALRSLSAAAQVGILFTLLLVQLGEEVAAAAVNGGSWQVVVQNAGIASMHTAVTHYGNVVLLDRTNIGPSQLPLPPGVCRNNPQDKVSKLRRFLASSQLDQLCSSFRFNIYFD